MRSLLYIISVVLFVVWFVSYIGYDKGGVVHFLLVIALFAFVFRIIEGDKSR